jgi:hypothetical protein
MATWQTRGVTSPVQAWDPDFSFLAQTYAVNQARYDKGFNQVKSVYNSLLNSPLTNESNKAYRDEVFKRLNEHFKAAGHLDFSRPDNVAKAVSLMDPLTKDEDLAYDMAVTKYHNEQRDLMNSYKNSTDSEMRKLYSDYAAQAIGLAESDLAAAKRGDGSIKAVAPQDFVPFEDINEFLSEAAKRDGLVIKSYGQDGGYILEQENGKPAIMPFAAWAKQQMAGRFDRQINLQAKVMAEGKVRNAMQQQGISRQDAIMQIAEKETPSYVDKHATDIKGLTSNLQTIEREIAILEKSYAGGVPSTMPHLKDHYDELVEQRDIHKKLISGGTNTLSRINQEQSQYMFNNLYNVYADNVSDATALGWATTRALATEKQEIKPDQVWISKYNNQVKIALKQAEMQWDQKKFGVEQAYKAANLRLDQERLAFDYWKEMQPDAAGGSGSSKSGKKGSYPTVSGDAPGSFFLGYDQNAGGFNFSSDLLSQRTEANYNKLFTNLVKADSGLLNIILPEVEYNTAATALNHLKQIADGTSTKALTQQEQAIMSKLGNKLEYEFNTEFVHESPAMAQKLIQAIGIGSYQVAQQHLASYKNTGTVPEYVSNLQAFEGAMTALEGIMEDEEAIKRSHKNVAAMIANDTAGIYGKPEITGYLEDGTPVYDLSELTDEAKSTLTGVIAQEFDMLTAPANQAWELTGLNPGEMSFFFNDQQNVTVDGEQIAIREHLGDLVDLPDDQLAELYSDRMTVNYNPIQETAEVTFKVNPTAPIAKSLNKKVPETVTFNVPYSTLTASAQSVPRLALGAKQATASEEGAGRFTPLQKNPYSQIKSPSYMDAVGFEYDIAGTTLSDGNYGLNIVTKHFDPYQNKYVTNTTPVPISNPGDPMAYTMINDQLNKEFNQYMMQLGHMKHLEKEVDKLLLKVKQAALPQIQ